MKIIEGVKKGAAKVSKKVSPKRSGHHNNRSKEGDMPDLDEYSDIDQSQRSRRSHSRSPRRKGSQDTLSRSTRGGGGTDLNRSRRGGGGDNAHKRLSRSVNPADDREARDRLVDELGDSSTTHSVRRRRGDRGRSPMKDTSSSTSNHNPPLRKSPTREGIKAIQKSQHKRLVKEAAEAKEQQHVVDTGSPALSSTSSALASASASAAAAAASAATAAALAASLIPTDGSDAMPNDPVKLARIASIVAEASEAASAAAKAAQALVTTLSNNSNNTSPTLEDASAKTETTALETASEHSLSQEFVLGNTSNNADKPDPHSSLASMGISLVN